MTFEDIYMPLIYEFKATHVDTNILGPRLTGLKLKQFRAKLNKREFDEKLLAIFSQKQVSLADLAQDILERRA